MLYFSINNESVSLKESELPEDIFTYQIFVLQDVYVETIDSKRSIKRPYGSLKISSSSRSF